MNGDTPKALGFLKKMYPEGPWALTAIQLDRKAIETITFTKNEIASMSDWINEYNGLRNLYFHVNPPRHRINKKAERTDIGYVYYLHVDVDPLPDRPLTEERDRCLKLLTTNRPKGVPDPTIITFSGGGYQAFWKLADPIEIGGDLNKAEDAKRYNQQLESIFGADNCHNIDRLMRLPGTVNIPDAKKLKKGRTKQLAKLLQHNPKHVYELKEFTPAAQVSVGGGDFKGSASAFEVEISGNVRRLDSIDELDEWDVPDRVKVVCVQGRHPDEVKEKDNSRSAWLFDAVCNLVRCGVPDEVIFSIITDPDFGISDSVLEMKGRAEKYAIRQIGQAKEHAVDPNLRELNARYAVITNFGGKCRIVERVEDERLGRSRITKCTFEDFRNSWMHQRIKVGEDKNGVPQYMPMGKWWLQHPQRRQYRTLVFAPGLDVKSDGYNLWQGFAVASNPGDCSILLDHVKRNVCGENEEYYEYLLNWMARAVQQPASQGEVAVVLRGAMGVGKSILARVFGKLWGSHYMVVSNSSHLVGNFNAHLRDVCFLFADEAFFAGDKKHRSVLRSLITDELIPVEPKGVDVEMVPNCLHIMMASNDRHVIPAGEDERRYFVLDVAKGNHQDTAFFRRMLEQMKDGGYEGFLHFLLARDISNFNVRDVPKTEALYEQKLLSLGPEEEWWYAKLVEGRILEEHTQWEACVIKNQVVDDYVETVRRFNSSRRGSATQLGRFLQHHVPGLETRQLNASMQVHVGNGVMVEEKPRRYYHYCFPPLGKCREAWDEKYGKQNWPAPISDGEGQLKQLPEAERIPF